MWFIGSVAEFARQSTVAATTHESSAAATWKHIAPRSIISKNCSLQNSRIALPVLTEMYDFVTQLISDVALGCWRSAVCLELPKLRRTVNFRKSPLAGTGLHLRHSGSVSTLSHYYQGIQFHCLHAHFGCHHIISQVKHVTIHERKKRCC